MGGHSGREGGQGGAGEARKSIKDLLTLIPPASSLRVKERRHVERRVRLRFDSTLERDTAKINPGLARDLGISEMLEIVVAGRVRFAFKVVLDERVEPSKVHVSPDLMEENGVADNSIATVRAYKGGERLGARLPV